MNVGVARYCNFLVTVFFCVSIFLLAKPFPVQAAWNGNPYAVGQTLNPECAPTDQNCLVAVSPWLTDSTSTTTSLNVGIGTTTPQYKLDVNGDINFTGTFYQNGVPFSGGVLTINESNAIWSSDTSQPTSNNVLAIGDHAGFDANGNSQKSNFIGYYAGNGATNAYNANFIGVNAGDGAIYADKSNFIGHRAGYTATNAQYSNFLGRYTGYGATYAYHSNFTGNMAGYQAVNAFYANFIGERAGYAATNAANAIFIGDYAGNLDAVNNTEGGTSIAIGRYSGTGGFSDSIAIGHGVINNAANQFNIGNVLYGTGIYASDNQSSTPTGGSIGIGTSNPLANLDVNGSVVLSGENSYLNFGSGVGSNGFGFRDNGGVMQYKNATDPDWSNLGGGSSAWQGIDGGIAYSGGTVGIGTTSPTSLLDVVSTQSGQVPVATLESYYESDDQGPSIDFRDAYVPTTMFPDPSARIQALAVAPGGAGLGFYYNQGLFGQSHSLIEAMRISGFNGYVGIGNTDPLHLLDLTNANINTDGSAAFAGNAFTIANNGDLSTGGIVQSKSGVFEGVDQYHKIAFSNGGNNTDYFEWGDTLANGGGHRFFTGGDSQSLRMQIANDGTYFSGNVGIGTLYPTHNLSFPADTPATIGVESSGGQGISGGDLTISAGTDTGGYNGGGSLILKAGNAFAGGGEHAGDIRLYAGGNNYSEGSVLGNIIFYKGELNGAYTEAMRMNNVGHLGIGTASPTSALTVNYDEGAYSSGGISLINTNAGNWPAVITLGNGAQTSTFSAGNGSDTVLIQAGNSGGVALGSGDTSWHSASDARLKKNVQDISDAATLDKVLALDPVTFNWIDPNMSTTTQYGFIAQDVLNLFPELVSKPTDPSKCVPGNAMNNCYGVSYDRFGVLAIAAIKGIANITGTFKNNLVAWFADATNGIQNLFVKEVHTNKICVAKSDGTEVCVTGDELQKLVSPPAVIISTGDVSSGGVSTSTDSGTSTTTGSGAEDSSGSSQQPAENGGTTISSDSSANSADTTTSTPAN